MGATGYLPYPELTPLSCDLTGAIVIAVIIAMIIGTCVCLVAPKVGIAVMVGAVAICFVVDGTREDIDAQERESAENIEAVADAFADGGYEVSSDQIARALVGQQGQQGSGSEWYRREHRLWADHGFSGVDYAIGDEIAAVDGSEIAPAGSLSFLIGEDGEIRIYRDGKKVGAGEDGRVTDKDEG